MFDNGYWLELLEKFDIYAKFNVVDFYEFHEWEEILDKGTLNRWECHLSIKP
jgi:hypothetical protein